MKIALNDVEFDALCGLPHAVICLYIIAIRPRMDYITGLVGIRPLISWQALTEWVYVEPRRGLRRGSTDKWAVRRMAWQLERAGLINIVSNSENKQLIFECVLARRDKSVQKKPATNPPHKPAIAKAAPVLGSNGKAATSMQGKAAIHPVSDKTFTSITTTTTANSFSGGGDNEKNEAPPLIWPRQLSLLEKTHAETHLDGLPGTDAQLVLDEYAGIPDGTVRNPVRYIARLAREAKVGRFVPELAHRVRADRERAAASAAAVAAARAQYLARVEQQPTRPMTDAEISQLPASISRIFRRKRNGNGNGG